MSKLDEVLDWLAEDYVELEDAEVADMWKLDKTAAKKQIKKLFCQIITDHLDDITYTGVIKERIEDL